MLTIFLLELIKYSLSMLVEI